ncbi:hypothetical protein GCK72_012172 [Caenorhabditis remanei]|uniref:Uncharacterized protein n=1 Tax=Caenorhabditis remanei TaxID=31234 RepID=A0A6A5GMI1_CAERE|nr:hypothetical protein GCK72_012172 [Caenorhabditis remanei]KAF1755722.1 hypothetical protein GCK72_012172 [Caenorhabditis remanei]
MKTLLVISLLLCHFLSEALSPEKKCLQKINEARAEYAGVHRIANMNELKYNKRLEMEMVDEIPKHTCPNPLVTSDNNVEVFWNIEESGETIVKLLAAPERTVMACKKRYCEETGKEVISIIADSSLDKPINGEPGSECSRYRTPSNNGLCVLKHGYRRKILGGLVEVLTDVTEGLGEIAIDAVKMADKVKDLTVGTAAEVGEKLAEVGIHVANEAGKAGKDYWDKHKKDIVRSVGEAVFVPITASVGFSIGASLGTVTVPVIGTVGFGAAGGIAGTIIGNQIVDMAVDAVKK